jgi:hypothetical protein
VTGAPISNDHPDKVYIWHDEDGVRCSPRHRTFKAALGFLKNQESTWFVEDGRRVNKPIDRNQFPSQKQPVKLVVGVWEIRDLTPEEQTKLNQVKSLMEEGLV